MSVKTLNFSSLFLLSLSLSVTAFADAAPIPHSGSSLAIPTEKPDVSVVVHFNEKQLSKSYLLEGAPEVCRGVHLKGRYALLVEGNEESAPKILEFRGVNSYGKEKIWIYDITFTGVKENTTDFPGYGAFLEAELTEKNGHCALALVNRISGDKEYSMIVSQTESGDLGLGGDSKEETQVDAWFRRLE